MRLFYSPTSPYVRKVSVTALELGIGDRLESVTTDPRDAASGFWSRNPLGKVPALELDSGEIVYDSPVICEYLNEAHGGRLLPGDLLERARIRTLVALADGIMDAGILARLEGLRPEDERSAAWLDKQHAVIGRGLDRLEEEAEALAGEIDLGSIAVGCALGWIAFRLGADEWLSGRRSLARWFETFDARPSMAATRPG